MFDEDKEGESIFMSKLGTALSIDEIVEVVSVCKFGKAWCGKNKSINVISQLLTMFYILIYLGLLPHYSQPQNK